MKENMRKLALTASLYIVPLGALIPLTEIQIRNGYHTGRRVDMVVTKNIENNCRSGAETYKERFLENEQLYLVGLPIPSTSKELKKREIEIDCGTFYPNRFPGEEYHFVIADREVFPDGRVNVLWDPGNKYKSTERRQ